MYAVCKTDIGQVRSSNQDICRCGTFSDGSAWTVVCDGMGGQDGSGLEVLLGATALRPVVRQRL